MTHNRDDMRYHPARTRLVAFTRNAGQGGSNIRRWILENDWLEAIIALPLNMFYNTGIATYS
jgi:type I restriction-modification system DNA methylase subunit